MKAPDDFMRKRPRNRDVLRNLTLSGYVAALIDMPGLLDELDSLPGKKLGTPGRPATLPPAVAALCMLIVSDAGNMTEGVREISDLWQDLQRELGHRYPNYPALQRLSDEEFAEFQKARRKNSAILHPSAPTRQVLSYWRDTRLVGEGERHLRRVHKRITWQIAAELGILQGRGSYTNPHYSDVLYGDGTVLRARSKAAVDTSTGEIKGRRVEHDALLHHQGNETKATGIKLVILGASNGHPQERLIIDVDTAKHDEADVGVRLIKGAVEGFPATRAVTWDKALEGRHVDAVQKMGIVVAVPVKNQDGGPRERVLGVKTLTRVDGSTVAYTVYLHDGWPHVDANTVGKKKVLVPLVGRQILRRKNRNNIFRMYRDYTLPAAQEEGAAGIPASDRGASMRLSLTAKPEDKASKLHRAQHLRAHRSTELGFKTAASRRPSAESQNSWVKDHLLPQRLAPVYGADRLRIHMLFMAILKNTRARIAHGIRMLETR